MTDRVIQASLQNPLLQGLYKAKLSKVNYGIKVNYPATSKTITTVNPLVALPGAPWGGRVDFNLPQTGFLDRITISNVLTLTAGAHTANVVYGRSIIDRIECQASNKTIFTVSGDALEMILEQEPMSKALAIKKRMLPTSTSGANLTVAQRTAATSYRLDTYIPASVFEDVTKAIDLTKTEILQIRVYYKSSAAEAGMGAAVVTNVQATLNMWVHNFEANYYDELRRENFGGGRLEMLTHDYFTERFLQTTTSTSTTVDIRFTGAAMWTGVYIVSALGLLVKVFSGTLRFDGRNWIEAQPVVVGCLEQDMIGSNGLSPDLSGNFPQGVTINNTNLGYIFNFGLMPGLDANTGALSYKGVASPQITVTHAAAAAGDQLVVVHKHITVTAIDNSGKIETSWSS